MDVVLPYVHERKQFGEKIGNFQLIQAKLADMYVALQASRSLSYATAQALDRGELEAKDCAAAILHSAEHGTQCALQAIQVLCFSSPATLATMLGNAAVCMAHVAAIGYQSNALFPKAKVNHWYGASCSCYGVLETPCTCVSATKPSPDDTHICPSVNCVSWSADSRWQWLHQ
jgi:alkylation response protein AidB-like acyl-CoA dehydrogenase